MILKLPKFKKVAVCTALTVALIASSAAQAAACCGLYIGSDKTENGSTFVGRSEDIGKLYDKVFEVHPAEEHEPGDMYRDAYGFSMPYPTHTYRYTVMRDSINRGETILVDGQYTGLEAYGEVGINEKGVAVSATVTTGNNKAAKEADPLVKKTGICEISLNSVILMQADTAKDGVEILAAIIDEYGSGECNSLTISDANEVWDFEVFSGHQYVAYKMPSDKVSVNPNLLIMREIDITDTENVIASPNLITLAQENGFLVSSQLSPEEEQNDEENVSNKENIFAQKQEEDLSKELLTTASIVTEGTAVEEGNIVLAAEDTMIAAENAAAETEYTVPETAENSDAAAIESNNADVDPDSKKMSDENAETGSTEQINSDTAVTEEETAVEDTDTAAEKLTVKDTAVTEAAKFETAEAETAKVENTEDTIGSDEDKTENVEVTDAKPVSAITKIDIAASYGSSIGKSNNRYWQGVYYLTGSDGDNLVGDMLLDTNKTFDTYEALRFLAYRGEGTSHDGNAEGAGSSIGNERQAECHVFEIRKGMPDELAVIQWQTLSRAEFSVYLPFYSALLTDTSEIFKTEYVVPRGTKEVSQVINNEDFPKETSINWVFSAINDLCDNDRTRYGSNVKKFFEDYQKELIEQQKSVDADMKKIYAYSPKLAEEKATALGIAVAEEAFDYAKIILTELCAFIDEHGDDDQIFVPSVLSDENAKPHYSLSAVGGTGVPNKGGSHKNHSSATNGENNAEVQNNTQANENQNQSNSENMLFTDVKSGAWYDEAVSFAVKNGLMKGTGVSSFSPNAGVTRGMLVTILYRLSNEPAAANTNFSDVKNGEWYSNAVAWAEANSIIMGYEDGTFGAGNMITREDLVTILYRYAALSGMETGIYETDSEKSVFTDSDSISEYAEAAAEWAVSLGIVKGTDSGKFLPQDWATRVQTAQILMNFCENTGK